MRLHARAREATEWALTAASAPTMAPDELDVDAVITGPDGGVVRAPAFWAGGVEWRVRFAPPAAGEYRWRSECPAAAGSGLHGVEGALMVGEPASQSALLARGPLRVAADRRHLEHADGTPFFWLADTWWMGLCKRWRWPEDFRAMVADRTAKGFTVIQIVAGMYPDMDAFDPRGENEAGFPWDAEWRVRPEYYDSADLRIQWLARCGLVPCIVGCWGYYIHRLGVERMKRHWRNLVARYHAYPVVWCLAGEVLMPYYLEPLPDDVARERHVGEMRAMWNEVGAYVRSIDPVGHPVTAHPSTAARDSLDDAVLDFDMLQTGHGDRTSLPNTVKQVVRSYSRAPAMPVINGEVCYEGIGEASRQEVQRLMFWVCMLSGACGHTYGANGIWQINETGRPYGPSPHGMSWGDTPWEEAARLPGSEQVGLGKRLLERYRWWEFAPRQAWVEPRATPENPMAPFAAGIAGQVRVVFTPSYVPIRKVLGMEPGVTYRAFFWDPKNGAERDLGEARADSAGSWACPQLPIFQDWVLVLEAPGARVKSA